MERFPVCVKLSTFVVESILFSSITSRGQCYRVDSEPASTLGGSTEVDNKGESMLKLHFSSSCPAYMQVDSLSRSVKLSNAKPY